MSDKREDDVTGCGSDCCCGPEGQQQDTGKMPVPQLPIYFDDNATTPLDRRVLDAMMPYLTTEFGNAASRNHPFGWKAEAAVENAREQVARLIGASAKDMVFTSGATESNNLAIKGVAGMYAQKGKHIITCFAEHKAVLDPCQRLAEQGFDVTFLKPDETGKVTAEMVAAALRPDTILISLMLANNEIGTISPVAQIGKLATSGACCFTPTPRRRWARCPSMWRG